MQEYSGEDEVCKLSSTDISEICEEYEMDHDNLGVNDVEGGELLKKIMYVLNDVNCTDMLTGLNKNDSMDTPPDKEVFQVLKRDATMLLRTENALESKDVIVKQYISQFSKHNETIIKILELQKVVAEDISAPYAELLRSLLEVAILLQLKTNIKSFKAKPNLLFNFVRSNQTLLFNEIAFNNTSLLKLSNNLKFCEQNYRKKLDKMNCYIIKIQEYLTALEINVNKTTYPNMEGLLPFLNNAAESKLRIPVSDATIKQAEDFLAYYRDKYQKKLIGKNTVTKNCIYCWDKFKISETHGQQIKTIATDFSNKSSNILQAEITKLKKKDAHLTNSSMINVLFKIHMLWGAPDIAKMEVSKFNCILTELQNSKKNHELEKSQKDLAQTNDFEQSSDIVSKYHAETSLTRKNDRNKPPKNFPKIVQSMKTSVGGIKKTEIKPFYIANERLLDALETCLSDNTPRKNRFKITVPIGTLPNPTKGSSNNRNRRSLGKNRSSVPTSISSQEESNIPQTPDTKRPKADIPPLKGYPVREAIDFIEPEYIVCKGTVLGSILQNNLLKAPCIILPKKNFTKENLFEDDEQMSSLFNCNIPKDKPSLSKANFQHRANITKPFGLTPMYSSKFKRCMNTTAKNNIFSKSFN